MRFIPALIILIAVPLNSVRAGSCLSGCKSPGSCRPVPHQETIKEECFDVECEYICIPGIKFPWQRCCEPPSCGRVRCVHRLTSHEHERGAKTVWDWEITRCGDTDCVPPVCTGTACVPGRSAPMN